MRTDLNKQRVNYDTIAHLYDEPIRYYAVDENLAHFLAARPSLSPVRILDMGCGTGKQLAANRPHFPGALMAAIERDRQQRGIRLSSNPNSAWSLSSVKNVRSRRFIAYYEQEKIIWTIPILS